MRYFALVRAGFRRSSTYRAATLAGIFTNTVFGFIRAGILLAALAAAGSGAAGSIAGYDRAAVLTYTWLGQGFIAVIAAWNWVDLATRIRTGDVVTDMQRPVDLQAMYLAEDYGRALYQGLARGVPPFVIGALVFDLRLPDAASQWCAFAVSVVLAVAVSFAVRFLWNLAAFWILDYRGLQVMAGLCVTLLSGLALPLAFYPAWAERLMFALPWASMLQIPIDVFLGRHTGAGLAGVLALQATWAFTLLLAGRFALAAATRRVVVQGG